MNGQVILLGLLFISLAIGAQGMCGEARAPKCRMVGGKPFCPEEFVAVCGSDGVTYQNECALCFKNNRDNSDVTIIHDGECKVPAD
ncbi:serine peptidase inhibitor%2C Kazal type 4 [Xyrichtys novacula]|uniref:Serine peptidase inhibitor, Kazal type 4 n=1 Tax=Xyrichtys novacula TaxID=13765 RepID=A0AAV1EVE8_XYRNO|nr:serine peptidase inhibitor%2C Kazal type 4 [Xyrichtys novacula]